MLAVSATAKAISIITSSNGLHSLPRNISSSSRRSISGSHRSINSSSSCCQDTLADGDHRVFVSVAAQPGHFYVECRAIPPAPLNTCPPAPYTTPQGDPQANYSAISPGDYASSSGREYGQQMPTPAAPHGPPLPSASSWSFSTDRAVMTQFCPPDEFVSLSGIVSSSSTRTVPARVTRSSSNNYLHSVFAAQSKDSSSHVWIGDSGASCHVTNKASKVYCVRPPLADQREVTTCGGARRGVECVGNFDVVFQGEVMNQSRCVISRTYQT